MKRHNLRKDSKLLVQSILAGDMISADKLFSKLITQAEEDRQNEAAAEVAGETLEDAPAEETEEIADTEIEANDTAAELDESLNNVEDDLSELTENMDPGLEDAETTEEIETDSEMIMDNMSESDTIDEVEDDLAEITRRVNEKLISNLFDKLAIIKNGIDQLGLDPESRESIQYEMSLEYYSEKLLLIQTKVNEKGDQDAINSALDKIKASLEQIAGQAGINPNSDLDVQTPGELEAESGLTDDENIESVTDGDESTEVEEIQQVNEEAPEEIEVVEDQEEDFVDETK